MRLGLTMAFLVLLVLGSWSARPRKEIDRETPLGHDVEPDYEKRCADAVGLFDEWLADRGWFSAGSLAEMDVRTVGTAMSQYILDLFEDEATRDEAEIAVLGFQRKFWWQKMAMAPAWKLLKEWRLREPLELRAPAPVAVVRAVISTALSWGWTSFALCVWLGFVCLLRPGEICLLKKEDVRLVTSQFRPREFRRLGVLILNKPKTRKVREGALAAGYIPNARGRDK